MRFESDTDRRCAPRFPAYTGVRYESETTQATVTAHDLSRAGALVHAPALDAPGTEATVTIESFAFRQPIRMRCQVARQVAEPFAGMGVRFTGVDAAADLFLRSYCEAFLERHRVVMVEDETAILRMMGRLMARENLSFFGIDLPLETERVIERFAPHAIILDVMMPGVDGIELAQRLRKNPATVQTPVLFYSALNADVLPADLQNVRFLTKGCPVTDIVDAIRSSLAEAIIH